MKINFKYYIRDLKGIIVSTGTYEKPFNTVLLFIFVISIETFAFLILVSILISIFYKK